MILLITFGVLVVKSLIVSVTSLLLGYPLRTAIISGLTLGQVGEFAFILASVGTEYALLSPQAEQMFLAVSVITMAGTSFLIAGAPRAADWARMSMADLHLHLHDIEIAPIRISSDSPLTGQSLAELDLRNKTGLTLLAIRRNTQLLTNPDSQTKLCLDDELFVIGPPDKIEMVSTQLL